MRTYKQEKLRIFFEYLIKKLKPKKRIVLKFTKLNSCGSYSYSTSKNHYVSICDKHQYQVQLDTLLHEMAHCLEHRKYGKEHHSDAWGRKYAKCYRLYLEWLKELEYN